MRIVHVFRGFHDYLSELVNSEAESSEVHALVSQRDVPILADLKASVHVHRTEMPPARSPLNAVRLPRLWSLIREIDPDIVHMQSGLMWEYGLILPRRPFPIILTVHDIVNHPVWGLMPRHTPEFFTARATRSVDAVIVHGDSLRELALKRFEQNEGPSRVYSVDHGVISRFGIGSARSTVPPGSGNVLFFGYLQKNKGLEYLVAAEAILRRVVPNLSMVVAGAASHQAYYRGLIGSSTGISLRLGYQNRESVGQLFRWADVVVLPYIEASQSGVFQIATAFGVPSVATRVGGFPDVIRHRLNGLLVPPRDPLALAAAIRELLNDAALRARIIGNLQSDREDRFSWSRIASQTLGIYRQVIARFQVESQKAGNSSTLPTHVPADVPALLRSSSPSHKNEESASRHSSGS